MEQKEEILDADVVNIDETSLKKKKSKVQNILQASLSIALFITYVVILIIGIVQINNPTFVISTSQAQLIINSGIFGMLCALVPYLLEYICHIKINFAINLSIQILAFCSLALGEACEFYYKFPIWDDLEHFYSGVLFALVGTALVMAVIKNSNLKNKYLIAVMGGILFSLSAAIIWEIFEYAVDTFGGLNMQKSIPEIEGIFNGGSTALPLEGSDEVIAEFFRSPEGYRYALMDTMGDILCCFFRNLVFIGLAIGGYFINKNIFDNAIEFKPFKRKKVTDN